MKSQRTARKFSRTAAISGACSRSANPDILKTIKKGITVQQVIDAVRMCRRAGIRPETLNRIERGRTTPDFATVRKLVVAMNAAESQHAALQTTATTDY